MLKLWEFEAGRDEPRLDWKLGRMVPPEVELTPEDYERITVARRLNSITRAYILGLLAGMRRNEIKAERADMRAEALQRAIDRT